MRLLNIITFSFHLSFTLLYFVFNSCTILIYVFIFYLLIYYVCRGTLSYNQSMKREKVLVILYVCTRITKNNEKSAETIRLVYFVAHHRWRDRQWEGCMNRINSSVNEDEKYIFWNYCVSGLFIYLFLLYYFIHLLSFVVSVWVG